MPVINIKINSIFSIVEMVNISPQFNFLKLNYKIIFNINKLVYR